MAPDRREEDINEIETCWLDIHQAHSGQAEEVLAAQRRLIQRYGPAIFRYLRGAVHDQDAAEELYQRFALRFIRGDFRGADPRRGRFRQYLKTALFRLVADYQRECRRRLAPLPADCADPDGEPSPSAEADREFLVIWRDELLARAWNALANCERRSVQSLNSVLRFHLDHPELRSAQVAEHFSRWLGKPLNAAWARKKLHLARETLADLILDEVARTLAVHSREELEQELIDLGLIVQCRSALDRRAHPAQRTRRAGPEAS